MDYNYSKKSSGAAIFLILNLLSSSIPGSSCYAFGQQNTIQNHHHDTKSHTSTSSLTESKEENCPRDALKLRVCAKLLNGPITAVIGGPPVLPCCSVIAGLLDLGAGACLCTAIKANILGIDINIPIALSLLVNACGKQLPSDFVCA